MHFFVGAIFPTYFNYQVSNTNKNTWLIYSLLQKSSIANLQVNLTDLLSGVLFLSNNQTWTRKWEYMAASFKF